MKVLISADMEGTAGIVDSAQTAPPDCAHETAAACLHPEKARAAIRAGAAEAVRRAPRLRPFLPAPPIRLQVDVTKPDLADLASLCKGVHRTGSDGVAYEGPDMMDVWKTWLVMRNVMNSRMP